LWINGEHLKKVDPARIAEIIQEDFDDHFSKEALARVNTPAGLRLLSMIVPKVKLIKEVVIQLVPLCTPGAVEVETGSLKWNQKPDLRPVLLAAIKSVREGLESRRVSSELKVEAGDSVWGKEASL